MSKSLLVYFDSENNQMHYGVKVHNFSKARPNEVRIEGRKNLNPKGGNYSDRKWVKRIELFELTQKKFTEEEIKSQTI